MLKRISITVSFVMVLSAWATAQSTKTDFRIQLTPSEKREPHPLTLEEIIEMRETAELCISPDGETIAFTVKQASLATDGYRTALFAVKTSSPNQPVKLVDTAGISNLRWTPDGRQITYLSAAEGSLQIWQVSPDSQSPEQVTSHGTSISRFEWSPDGRKIAFLASEAVSPDEKSEVESKGVVYDDERHSHRTLISGSWITKPAQLWIHNLSTGISERVIQLDDPDLLAVSRFVWSPDGQKLALEYKPSTRPDDLFNSDIGLLDLSSAEWSPLITWEGRDYGASWSPDGRSIAFLSQGNINKQDLYYDSRTSIFVADTTEGSITDVGGFEDVYRIGSVWWSHDGRSLLYEWDDRSRSALFELPATGGAPREVSKSSDHLSSFSFDTESVVACIRQNPTTPPEIAVFDLTDGVPRTLTDLNPDYRQIRLGEVTELQWRNEHGLETNGFLIKPLDYLEGRRYPLLVVLYHFSNKFISQAQWMSSYPAQVFASHGFAVLLMNYPEWRGWRYRDFEKGAFWQGYNPLSSIKAGVENLVEMGIADPDRKGIMGWSFGSFLTEFTLTHSNLFQAASAGEGGLYNPGQYWLLGSASMRYSLEGLFGGPPYGEDYETYQEFSPALNAQKVRAPLLREYGPVVGIQSLEFYTALKHYGKPVEQVIYPNAPHVFTRPDHRLASMQRNLDWFRFWLQGEEDEDPSKEEQYSRWRQMKARLPVEE